MAWVILVFAGIFEIVWAYTMKMSEGFTKLTPSVITIFFMILSFGLLAYAMKSLALGNCLYDLDRNRGNWFIPCGYFYFR